MKHRFLAGAIMQVNEAWKFTCVRRLAGSVHTYNCSFSLEQCHNYSYTVVVADGGGGGGSSLPRCRGSSTTSIPSAVRVLVEAIPPLLTSPVPYLPREISSRQQSVASVCVRPTTAPISTNTVAVPVCLYAY